MCSNDKENGDSISMPQEENQNNHRSQEIDPNINPQPESISNVDFVDESINGTHLLLDDKIVVTNTSPHNNCSIVKNGKTEKLIDIASNVNNAFESSLKKETPSVDNLISDSSKVSLQITKLAAEKKLWSPRKQAKLIVDPIQDSFNVSSSDPRKNKKKDVGRPRKHNASYFCTESGKDCGRKGSQLGFTSKIYFKKHMTKEHHMTNQEFKDLVEKLKGTGIIDKSTERVLCKICQKWVTRMERHIKRKSHIKNMGKNAKKIFDVVSLKDGIEILKCPCGIEGTMEDLKFFHYPIGNPLERRCMKKKLCDGCGVSVGLKAWLKGHKKNYEAGINCSAREKSPVSWGATENMNV